MIIDAVFQEVDEMSGATFGVLTRGEKGKDAVTDQEFSPASENAQSGKAVSQAIAYYTFNELTPEMYGQDVSGTASPSAVVNYVNNYVAENGGGGSKEIEWELLGSKTLSTATTQENTKVQDYKTNLKGLRVKVIVPPDTGFSSNLISCQFALNNSRSFIVRANNISRITNANAYVYFEVLPKVDVWNCEVFPYDKSMGTISGDLMVTDADEIRHANVSATTLPIGTVIEFWGVK